MNQRPTPIFLPSSPSSNSPMEQLGRLGYGFSLLEEQVQLVLLSERICAGPIQTGDVLGGGGGMAENFQVWPWKWSSTLTCSSSSLMYSTAKSSMSAVFVCCRRWRGGLGLGARVSVPSFPADHRSIDRTLSMLGTSSCNLLIRSLIRVLRIWENSAYQKEIRSRERERAVVGITLSAMLRG